jgi:hypothetical protein
LIFEVKLGFMSSSVLGDNTNFEKSKKVENLQEGVIILRTITGTFP